MNKPGNLGCKDSIWQLLVEQIRCVLADLVPQREGICRFSVDSGGLNPVEWLGVQRDSVKIYYSQREGNDEIAGLGTADIVTDQEYGDLLAAIEVIEDRIDAAHGDIRYYGGACFDPDNLSDGNWDGFGRFRFVVPKFEIGRQGDKLTFSYNHRFTEEYDSETIIDEVGLLAFRFRKACKGKNRKLSFPITYCRLAVRVSVYFKNPRYSSIKQIGLLEHN